MISERFKIFGIFRTPPDFGDSNEKVWGLMKNIYENFNLGVEFYPSSIEIADRLLSFSPSGNVCTVHLPHSLDIMKSNDRIVINEFYRLAKERGIYGLVLHDNKSFTVDTEAVYNAFSVIEDCNKGDSVPMIFLEYAAFLEPEFYLSLVKKISQFSNISVCIDVGHIGLYYFISEYKRKFPGHKIPFSDSKVEEFEELMDGIQEILSHLTTKVCNFIDELREIKKPIHFHLHDGHPLSRLSIYGVSDHLSFLQLIPLPFRYQGKKFVSGFLGPVGLYDILERAVNVFPEGRLSFTLEIHPQPGRKPLIEGNWVGDCSFITVESAEKINYWIEKILENVVMVRAFLNKICLKN